MFLFLLLLKKIFSQFFISLTLMTNRAGLKLLQNPNKSPPALIGQGELKTLGFHNDLKRSSLDLDRFPASLDQQVGW